MSQETWSAVDCYLTDLLLPDDPALQAALEDSAAAGLPEIQVTPNQGKLLMLLAQMQQASQILELGTLGGYSTIWLARALPPAGRLISLEVDPKCAEVAARTSPAPAWRTGWKSVSGPHSARFRKWPPKAVDRSI